MNPTAKKSSTSVLPESAVLEVLSYFHFFSYAPTEEDIYMYLPVKMSKKTLSEALKKMESRGVIQKQKVPGKDEGNIFIYAMRGEGIFLAHHDKRYKLTQEKVVRMATLIRILQNIPVVRLIGLSGSCTMGNAQRDDDVDLFVITSPQRIWTARFVCICIAFLLGHKRNRGVHKAPNKACFNLFFDLSDVLVPPSKQNLYTGHEVLQMVPIGNIPLFRANKAYVRREKKAYKEFLRSNEWVGTYFPNAHGYIAEFTGAGRGISKKVAGKGILGNLLERILKTIQVAIMKKHKTKEIITDTQLWFFPRDFQSKLKRFIPKTALRSQR